MYRALIPLLGRPISFDVFVPTLNLALEYHGQQHYEENYWFGSRTDSEEREEEKRQACNLLGITLIEVPYWWQRDMVCMTLGNFSPYMLTYDLQQSIQALLQDSRPEVLSLEGARS